MISPELVRRYSFFGGFTAKELKELAIAGNERTFEPGETLFAEGDRADHLYFLAEGEVETLVHGEGEAENIPISTLPAGEPVGWSAVIEPHVYTASARSTRQSKVLIFGRDELARLLEDAHFAALLMRKVAEVVSRRLRDTQLQLVSLTAHQA
jgi:CRP/FNR family cyclic AMP-dependent transcriptional regulator